MIRNFWNRLRFATRSTSSRSQRRVATRKLRCEQLERREVLAVVAFESAFGIGADNGSLINRTGTVAHDSAGNTYLAGSYNNVSAAPIKVDFDPANVAIDDPAIVEAADTFGFVAKYDAAGAFQWVRTIEAVSAGFLELQTLKIGSSGALYFSGGYAGDYESNGQQLLDLPGNRDHFVGKLDSDGNVAWLHGIDLKDVYASIGGLAVDEANDRVYLSNTEFVYPGGGPGGYPQGIVIAVDIAGSQPATLWNAVLAVNTTQAASFSSNTTDVAVDSSGSVYVVGTFVGTADFDPAPAKTLSLSSGSGGRFGTPGAGYVWKLTPGGSLAWAKVFPGSKDINGPSGRQVEVDATHSVIVAGHFNGTFDFDPSKKTFSMTSVGGNRDAFLARFTTGGTFVTANQFGGALDVGISAMTLDSAGNVYLAGPQYLAKVNIAGSLMWSQVLSIQGLVVGISVSPAGKVHLAGYYQGILDADADPGNAELDSGDTTLDLFWLIYGQL